MKVQGDNGSGQPGAAVAAYAYDACGFRVSKSVGSDVTDYYYSDNWQLLQETKSGTASAQYVWDPRYVDAPVLRDRDSDGNGSLDERLYYTHDANFNTTALVTTAGAVVERYAYDAYGKAAVFDGAWQPRSASAYGNEVLFAGYRHDPETGLYLSRRRHYHATLGAWVSRDPAGYVDGNNLLEYVAGRPTGATDPTGEVAHVAAGAAAGATISVAFRAGSDLLSGRVSSYKDYAAAAAGGAAYGGTMAATGSFTAAGAASGAASNVTRQVLNLLDGTQKCFDFGSLAADTAIGAAEGMIAGGIGKAFCPANMLSYALSNMASEALSGALQGAINGYASGGLEGALQGAIDGAVRGAMSGLATGMVGYGSRMAAGTLPTGACFTAGTPILTAAGRVPIESLRVGQRVLTEDTKAEGGVEDATAIDPRYWRLVTLRMDNPDRSGDVLDIRLLRPLSWLHRFDCRAGGTIVLELAEMELEGPARVLSEEPCPGIEAGRGRVITATFTHLNGQVRELKLRGLERPLEPTKQHPVYSEDRQDWVAAEDLLPGERLRTADGSGAVVEWVQAKPGVHRVYNVEVEHEHQYFVSKLAVLAHNTYLLKRPGQHGRMDHRRTVGRLARLAEQEFPTGVVHYGTSIRSRTRLNRRPDVWVEDPGTRQVLKVYEAARTNSDGRTYVPRERVKQQEYDKAGIPSRFERVKY